MSNQAKQLHYLHELSEYKVAEGYPDVRGWRVIDEDQNTLGRVENFLVNKETMKVKYLDVSVEETVIEEGHKPLENNDITSVHEFISRKGKNKMIIPIEEAKLDLGNETVFTNGLTKETFS